MSRPDNHAPRKSDLWLYAPLGILPVVMGGLWILYIYAWASMVDPAIVGWDRDKLILSKLLPDALLGMILVLAGLAFSTICVASAVFRSARISRVVALASLPFVLALMLLIGMMWAVG